MKQVFSIYVRDLRGIVTNWAAAVVIGGLIILPSLYAWFNIEASWDPYGQTSGIKVAVVNQDAGAELRGQTLKIGDEIITSLKENHNIGWIFTDENKAMKGLNRGNYYAAIIIPEHFSSKIATVLSPNPEKAEILYYVNEKINAVAPKITSKGASSVTSEVNRNFIKTANGEIFKIFNQIGIELKQELPLIRKMKTLAFELEKLYPEISSAADTAVKDLHTTQTIVGKVHDELPRVKELALTGQDWADKTAAFLDEGTTGLETAAPVVKETLEHLKQTGDAASQLSDLMLAAVETGEDLVRQNSVPAIPEHMASALSTAADVANSLADMTERIQASDSSGKLSGVTAELRQTGVKFGNMARLIQEIPALTEKTGEAAKASIADFSELAKSASGLLGDLTDRFDKTVYPAMQSALERLKQDAGHAGTVLKGVIGDLPKVDKVLTDAGKGLNTAVLGAEKARKELPSAHRKLKEMTDRITTLESKGTIEDLIRLLSLNYAKESEFFAEPVLLKENRLFPIPNYGSAMSPFFTTLSVWVGGLLLVSMLTVEVHAQHGNFRSYHEYFGRFLTFLTLALLQTLVTTVGDLLVLGTYAVNPVRFVLFGLLLAVVFMLMIYTLVSVFGNVGKAMAIVLLVLQLAGSGGTFPIQVTPPFFQAIYPFLPFTYGISLMREAVGGIVPDIVTRDITMLLIYVVISVVLGIGLKKIVNRAAAKWVMKAKSGHLIH